MEGIGIIVFSYSLKDDGIYENRWGKMDFIDVLHGLNSESMRYPFVELLESFDKVTDRMDILS